MTGRPQSESCRRRSGRGTDGDPAQELPRQPFPGLIIVSRLAPSLLAAFAVRGHGLRGDSAAPAKEGMRGRVIRTCEETSRT
jgi:hypothetical protein